MGCFSTHEYRFTRADARASIARLVYFYGAERKCEQFTLPGGVQHGEMAVGKLEAIRAEAEAKAKTKDKTKDKESTTTADDDDGEFVVSMGTNWVGIAQAQVLPVVPKDWIGEVKAESPWFEDAKETLERIAARYRLGQEVMILHEFKGKDPMDEKQLAMLVRQCCQAGLVSKAFYDQGSGTVHMLVERGIVDLSTRGIRMGRDLDFDLDDGFATYAFATKAEEQRLATWNKLYVAAWIQAGRPCQPILPWTLV